MNQIAKRIEESIVEVDDVIEWTGLTEQVQSMIARTRAQHEYLTFIMVKRGLFCGIVQNETPKFIRFFDIEQIINVRAKQRFLDYADEWWWERNQSMPIDQYIGIRFDEFDHTLRGFPRKSLVLDPIGPSFSILDLYGKRVKKKRVDLLARRPHLAVAGYGSR